MVRQYGGENRNFTGEKSWMLGYAVSIAGFELEKVRKHIVHQEKLEKDQEAGKF